MSFSLSKSARLHLKTQASPRKSPIKKHTIPNDQKLKVFIKFKPQQFIIQKSSQISSLKPTCVIDLNNKQIQLQTSLTTKIYQFDHIFNQKVQSKDVFKIGCQDVINQVVNGVKNDKENNNGLVFVYGNTGTGKTYTMGLIDELSGKSKGIVPQALKHIFSHQDTIENTQICLSFYQIYKDQIYDLLSFQPSQSPKLSIREHIKSKQPFIQDLIMIQVNTLKQAYQLINIGLQKRRIAQQKVNKRSSRGHGVITVYIKKQNDENIGRVMFVDLAGCERIKESQSKGVTMDQAMYINSSLSALETLLMNISEQNIRSYRANKLTRLLQPYFQFGKIRLFVTSNYESTQSIEFAKRCKGIRFLQREVKKQKEQKVYKTPRKQSQKSTAKHVYHHSNTNQSKIQQQLQKLRKQYSLRQKSFLKCLSSMMSIIHKLHQSLSSSLSSISTHSQFSLPQLFQHLPLQSKVNYKLNIYQKKQSQIINFSQQNNDDEIQKLSQLSTNMSRSFQENKYNEIQKKTQEIMRNMQEIGYLAVKKVGKLNQLVEYKNVYKKEWFTAEIKNGLLENKNRMFEKGLGYLIGEVNTIGTSNNSKGISTSTSTQQQQRIFKKLKQLGIVLSPEQNQQNIKANMNRSKSPINNQNHNNNSIGKGSLKALQKSKKSKNSIDSSRSNNKNSHRSITSSSIMEDKQMGSSDVCSYNFDKSRKRSLIYIDQD